MTVQRLTTSFRHCSLSLFAKCWRTLRFPVFFIVCTVAVTHVVVVKVMKIREDHFLVDLAIAVCAVIVHLILDRAIDRLCSYGALGIGQCWRCVFLPLTCIMSTVAITHAVVVNVMQLQADHFLVDFTVAMCAVTVHLVLDRTIDRFRGADLSP